MSGTFYVFKCTRCGRWGVKELRVDILHGTYTCRYENCKKTTKIKKRGEFGLSMIHQGPFDNPGDAARICIYLNGMMGKKNV